MKLRGPKILTPLIWKSLENFDKSWSYLWTFPMEWDGENRALVYTGISKKLIPWFFALYGLSFPSLLVMFLILSVPLFGYNKVPFTDCVVILLLFVLSVFYFVEETFVLLFGQVPVHAANSLLFIHEALTKSKVIHSFRIHY